MSKERISTQQKKTLHSFASDQKLFATLGCYYSTIQTTNVFLSQKEEEEERKLRERNKQHLDSVHSKKFSLLCTDM